MFQYGLCELCQSNNCNVHSWEGQGDFTAQCSFTTHFKLGINFVSDEFIKIVTSDTVDIN